MTQETLPSEIRSWEASGQYLRVGVPRRRIFVRSTGPRDAPPARTLLVIHGFPESSLSFRRNVEALSRRFDRVVLLDLLGFGLSDKPLDASYSLFEQADLVLEVWRELGVRGGHLVGHDMGDSVVTELVARREGGGLPGWLDAGPQSLTFTNGNMVMELARLRLSQSLLRTRLGPIFGRFARYPVFAQQVRSASGGPLATREIELMWAALQHQEGWRVQHRLIGYLDERDRFQNTRWLPALAATNLPVHLCWGAVDRVAPARVAQHLKDHVCPTARLTLLPGVGHFCQQEDPEAWNRALIRFWDELG
jgi:pimeloyl-ACP methyl ester carboxylesterase